MNTIFIVIGIIAFLLIAAFIIMYNTVVQKKNQVENAFGSIDAMLKKRYDLIPNLVSTCKQYMEHENELLTKLTELRSKADSPDESMNERVDVENEITKTLGALRVTVENYPDLKANQNFIHLQKSLNEAEEQISAARRAYNAAVTDFNNSIEMFPTSIAASMMKLSRKKVFEIPEEERKNVNVGNLFNES